MDSSEKAAEAWCGDGTQHQHRNWGVHLCPDCYSGRCDLRQVASFLRTEGYVENRDDDDDDDDDGDDDNNNNKLEGLRLSFNPFLLLLCPFLLLCPPSVTLLKSPDHGGGIQVLGLSVAAAKKHLQGSMILRDGPPVGKCSFLVACQAQMLRKGVILQKYSHLSVIGALT